MEPMYKTTYFRRLYSYIEIGMIFFGTCCKTVWAAKPCKILQIRSGLNIKNSVLFLPASLTPNINKAKQFLKRV